MARKVRIDTRDEGVNFATVGVVRDARTGRKLAETGPKPYRSSSSVTGAEAIAAARGWQVVSGDDDR